MKRIIGIKFSHYGQIYFFYCEDPFVDRGDRVLAETGQGLGIATVMNIVDRIPEDLPPDGVRDVLRKVTDEDQIVAEENDTLTYSAHKFCESRIRERQLDMKLVDVEVLFDRSKLVFYFTAPTRIDFRELVKDLVREYHTRIELRQIGVRHETQMLGAVGSCGMVCCCRRFLRKFVPVTIKMAKEQNLSLNPTKISGVCGRLMCCLKYEQDAYEDAIKRLPKNDSFVLTPDGTGNVSDVNVLKETVNVRLDDRTDGPRCYHNCEVCVLRNGKGSREGIAVPDKRPERYVEPLAEEELPTITLLSDFDPDAAAESEKKRGRRSRSRRRGDGEKRTAEKSAAPAEKAPRSDTPAEGGKPRREGGDRRRRSGRRGGNGGANAAGSTGAPAPKAVKPAGDSQSAAGGEKKRSRHRPRRRSGGSKPNGGTEA